MKSLPKIKVPISMLGRAKRNTLCIFLYMLGVKFQEDLPDIEVERLRAWSIDRINGELILSSQLTYTYRIF